MNEYQDKTFKADFGEVTTVTLKGEDGKDGAAIVNIQSMDDNRLDITLSDGRHIYTAPFVIGTKVVKLI